MWFHLGFENFVAKKIQNDDFCQIFVSDFMRIWHKSLSNNELLSISQRLNPLFEAPVQKLKDLTLKLLGDVKVKKEVTEDSNNNILVKLESHVMNIKFQFDMTLSQGDFKMFYNEFTLPFILVLIKIQNKEKKLMEIIKAKDDEIKDYKQGYGIISNYLTTKPFSKKEFYTQESAIEIPWDNSFLDCISSKLCAVETEPQITQDFSSDGKPERMNFVDKIDKKNSVFKDKSLNQSSGSKPCVMLLDNKVIKKRKKHNDGFKIKL